MSHTPPEWPVILAGAEQSIQAVMLSWLPRLQPLLGRSLPSTIDARQGIPDGFDGITTRGLPERLLTTEWALADAAPELFLMRAAAGEQLHHQLARNADANRRELQIIVDTSPSQAGCAMLVPVAIALLLLRRGDSDVFWSEPDHPEESHPLDLDDPDSWLALLTTSTRRPVSVEDWTTSVDAVEGRTTVCIGQPPTGVGDVHVLVAEALDDAVVEVRVGSERVRLPQPEPVLAARALTGMRSFSRSTRNGSTMDPGQLHIRVHWSHKLGVYLWDQSTAHHFSRDRGTRLLTKASPGWRIIGVCWRGADIYVLQTDGESYDFGNTQLSPVAGMSKWQPGPESSPIHSVWRMTDGFVIHVGNTLVGLPDHQPETQLLCPAAPGTVQRDDHGSLLVLPLAKDGPKVGVRVSSATKVGPEYSFGATNMQADRVYRVWNGRFRATHGQSHFAFPGIVHRDNVAQLPAGDVLCFWQLSSNNVVAVTTRDNGSTLWVGNQRIDAPPLVAVAPHPSRTFVVASTTMNELIQIDLSAPTTSHPTVRSGYRTLIEDL